MLSFRQTTKQRNSRRKLTVMRLFVRSTAIVCSLFASSCLAGYGQSAVSSTAPSTETPAAVQPSSQSSAPHANADLGHLGAAVKVSLVGVGGEVAVSVTHHTNVRAGFNMISYSRGFDKDGISYAGKLNFKTFEAHYDIFPWAKSFHISPGVLVYAGDPITATSSVPGGQSFSLGGVTYYSDPSNPITGTGKIDFNRAAPMITFGWGNLVSRKEGAHFVVPFEMGVAFQGSPKASLALAGNVCDSTGVNCRNAGTDPTVQSNVISEQSKVNNSMSFFKAYPIISLGFGYKF
jgi:hypothetical protein